MKQILTASLFILMGTLGFTQDIDVKVSGNIFNNDFDSVYLSQFYGTHYVNLAGSKIDEKGNFSIATKVAHPDFYVVRLGDARVNLVLRDESDIKIYADAKNVNSFCNIVGSEESTTMKDFILTMEIWNQKKNQAIQELQEHPENEAEIRSSVDREYAMFTNNRQSYIALNQNSPILLVALQTIDPEQDWLAYESVAKQLQFALPGSPTVETAYENYLKLKKQREAQNVLAPGKPAPDFTETKADGSSMSLSDLKGKVVLLDFWASWCGPCRKENPNVVNMYAKYKNKGFTVMSVSLDQDKSRWLAAIEQDNLIWPNHVSDLGGWRSKVAQQYGVRGIPFTVLIDQDGNIIGTNLRGPALEQELARIFDGK